jgi:serine/threonine protein kinase
MEYLHSLRPAIVHRDLKSHNVLKGYDGSYKVCDFGLVKNKNTQAGTPAYMAPELFRNRSYNKSVDVFSFAVLLWEIFTGEVPYNRSDVITIRDKVLAGQRLPMPLPGGSGRLSRLVADCWYKCITCS